MNASSGSIRRRFLIGTVVWISLGVLLGGLLVSNVYRWNLIETYHEELGVHIDELGALAAMDAKGQPYMLRRLSDPRYVPLGSGFYWQINRDGFETVRSLSLGSHALDPKFAGSTAVNIAWTEGPSGEMLQYSRQVPVPGGPPLRLLIATDKWLVDESMAAFNRSLALALAGFATLMIAAGVLQVRFGLKPLDRLAQSIADVRSGRADRMKGTFPSEITPLVTDLNGLIESSEESVTRGRLIAGNLAHGLRTPLAILTDEADALRSAGNVAAADTILNEARTMHRQIDFHLARARNAAAQPIPGRVTELRPLVQRLVEAFTRLCADRGVGFALEAGPNVSIACDAVDLVEILSNLLDNAGKWAASRCVVRWHKVGPRVRIEICDDGPGLPADQHEQMFRSGVRLDELTPGSGLGLAISRDLARTYGGEVQLRHAPGKGLLAAVELPSPDQLG